MDLDGGDKVVTSQVLVGHHEAYESPTEYNRKPSAIFMCKFLMFRLKYYTLVRVFSNLFRIDKNIYYKLKKKDKKSESLSF